MSEGTQTIDWLRTVAGAMAAVATAVLLSTLGAAGTLIGAAIGSVAMSVVTSLFASGMARGRQRVLDAQAKAMRDVGVAQAELRRATRRTGASEAHLEHAEEMLVEAKEELSVEPRPTLRDRLQAVSWPRAAAYAAGLFVVVVAVITGFELITGEPVSSMTGGSSGSGTSLTRVGGSGGHKRPTKESSVAPSPTVQPTQQQPTTQSTPTTEPTPTPSTTTPSPSPTAPTSPSDTASVVVPSPDTTPTQ